MLIFHLTCRCSDDLPTGSVIGGSDGEGVVTELLKPSDGVLCDATVKRHTLTTVISIGTWPLVGVGEAISLGQHDSDGC